MMEIPTQPTQESATEQKPQSLLLSEEEVDSLLNPTDPAEGEEVDTEEDVVLPSEEVAFVMPEKFAGKSAEDIAKAYIELEKMKEGKAQEDAEEPDGKETVPNKEVEITQEELSKYVTEFNEGGALSEESYAELEAKGLSREQVDEQIDYIKYKQDKAAAKLLEPFGTMDDFKAAAEWARQNWTEAQVTNFNKKLSTSDEETINALLTGLFAGYNATKPKETQMPDMLHGEAPKPVKPTGYESKSDMMKDMNDPRYAKDEVFRSKVAAKMAKTDMSKWY